MAVPDGSCLGYMIGAGLHRRAKQLAPPTIATVFTLEEGKVRRRFQSMAADGYWGASGSAWNDVTAI